MVSRCPTSIHMSGLMGRCAGPLHRDDHVPTTVSVDMFRLRPTELHINYLNAAFLGTTDKNIMALGHDTLNPYFLRVTTMLQSGHRTRATYLLVPRPVRRW